MLAPSRSTRRRVAAAMCIAVWTLRGYLMTSLRRRWQFCCLSAPSIGHGSCPAAIAGQSMATNCACVARSAGCSMGNCVGNAPAYFGENTFELRVFLRGFRCRYSRGRLANRLDTGLRRRFHKVAICGGASSDRFISGASGARRVRQACSGFAPVCNTSIVRRRVDGRCPALGAGAGQEIPTCGLTKLDDLRCADYRCVDASQPHCWYSPANGCV